MPNHDNQNAANDTVNQKTRRLTALYQKQRAIKAEMDQLALQKVNAYHSEVAAEAQPLWNKVKELADELIHHSHGYGAGWSRLYDFVWRIHAAFAKEAPLNRAKAAANYAPIMTAATWAAGGLVGGLVGGVGGMFCLGDGAMAGVKNGIRFATGASNDEVRYFVACKDNGALDYWVNRSDGKALTLDQKIGYMADVQCWLKSHGYDATDTAWTYVHPITGTLTPASFATMRDNKTTGLAAYFGNNALEVKQTCNAQKLEDDVTEEHWHTVSMGM